MTEKSQTPQWPEVRENPIPTRPEDLTNPIVEHRLNGEQKAAEADAADRDSISRGKRREILARLVTQVEVDPFDIPSSRATPGERDPVQIARTQYAVNVEGHAKNELNLGQRQAAVLASAEDEAWRWQRMSPAEQNDIIADTPPVAGPQEQQPPSPGPQA